MNKPYYSNAPVSVAEVIVNGESIIGFAAPQSGGPCLLKLTADDTPISFAVAAAYSEAAATEGLRSGWCGFELHGLRAAIALGGRVEVSCAVSGRILKSLTFKGDDMPSPAATSHSLTVEDLLGMIRKPRSCSGADQILPFAMNHLRRHGVQSFRDMAYLTLLGRWPDGSAPYPEDHIAEEKKRISVYLDALLESEEFQSKWAEQLLPGPFHPNFRFDTTGIL